MASTYHVLFVCLILSLTSMDGLEYRVINNAKGRRGGQLFDEIIGEKTAKSLMLTATTFAWHTVFHQMQESNRKQVERISLIIQSRTTSDSDHVIYVERFVNDQYFYEIVMDAHHVIESHVPENFLFDKSVDSILLKDKVRYEINWRLTVGVAFALQWTANGAIPQELRNGIAAFAVLEAYQQKPSTWVEMGEGNEWDETPDVTAQFLHYINGKKTQFVAELNKMMRTHYDESYFEDLAGMTIHEYWKIYKEDTYSDQEDMQN